MKSILIIIAASILAFSTSAQTLNGYVVESSATSPTHRPLKGVSVRLSGNVNAALSDKKGYFSVSLPNQREGGRYVISSIYKKGYELADPLLVGRPLAYSSKLNMKIRMLSSKVLNDRKAEIENKVYANVQKQYDSKLAALKDSLKKGRMDINDYMAKSNALQSELIKYEPLFIDLVDHYARLDYSNMNDGDKEVCLMIMEGDIERADSLISILEKKLQDRKEVHNREKEDIVNDLYNKYAIALSLFNTRKAGEYIYLRAEVDSTDVDCLLEAGFFACEYDRDLQKSTQLYDKALKHALQLYGKESEKYALCLNHKGGQYLIQNELNKSLELRKEALEIRKRLFGDIHSSVAACYNNLANIYYNMRLYNDAEECAEQAVEIYKNIEDFKVSDYCEALCTLGGIKLVSNEMNNATALFEDAIRLSDEHFGPENLHSATSLNNLAVIKDYEGKSHEALPLYLRAAGIYKKIYGDCHPRLASLYSNIGDSYKSIQQFDSSINYHKKSLNMRLNLLGDYNKDVAYSMNNIASVYSSMGEKETAIDYYKKCISVWKNIMRNDNDKHHLATTLGNLGTLYYNQKDYWNALPYLEESLALFVEKPEEYTHKLKSLGELSLRCYCNLKQNNELTEEEFIELMQGFEIFKNVYSKYINSH